MSNGPEGNRDVIEDISPRDVMYKGDPDHYLLLGGLALETIQKFMALVRLPTPSAILDLPCGHGRVLRFLRAAFPDAAIGACDLDADAVDFCARTFHAQPIYSTTDVTAVPLPERYDLIWCGSLLTHVHADQWRGLLQLFAAHLADTGLLVFTTHGRYHANRLRSKQTNLGLSEWGVAAVLSDYQKFGFGYQNYAGQEGYGISLSSASWVCSQIVQTPGLRLAGYRERGWADHQDAVACLKADASNL